MELTTQQKEEQQIKQLQILGPLSIVGLIAGVIYASKTGKSKWGWGFVGWVVPAALIGIVLSVTDYGNPTK